MLTTTEKFDAEFLRQNKSIWEPLFKFNRALKDTTWSKIVIHDISTDIFNTDDGMQLLEEEIKVYNGLNPIIRPRWLSSLENRREKKHGSVVVCFESKPEADKALRNRLQIAGESMRTTEYISVKPTHQCQRCLQFGHSEVHCYREQICAICAKNHEKRFHFCVLCSTRGEKCTHTKPKCSNCQGEHEALDRTCPIYQELSTRGKRMEKFSHIQL